jgi:transketolase
VLSAGHGSMLLYALLYLTGNPTMTIEEIKRFRQLGSKTPGHPENFVTRGIETTTGPLGQGIATAVGMALAERLLAAEFGGDLVDHHTYVLASDGDLMEGISQEAIAFAGHLKLNKLIVLFDDNGISIDGRSRCRTRSIRSNASIRRLGRRAHRRSRSESDCRCADSRAQKSDRPTLIACKTVIGFGAPTKAARKSRTARRSAQKKSKARGRT